MPRLTTIGVTLVVAALLLAGTVAATGGFAAQTQTAGNGPQAADGTHVRAEHGPGPFAGPGDGQQFQLAERLQERFGLTDEQTEEIQTLAADMRADGATRDEIQTAVHDKLLEFGVDEADLTPDPALYAQDRLDLTDEQVAELEALVTEMRDDGATTDDVRAAVSDQLAEWGIEHPVRDCDGDGMQVRRGAATGGGFGPRGTMA
ncbi:hypothetical protein GJR96_07675 [Haloferax sp. MBLA0076]|uniref:Uncharacterized protein n=1 Tax=Haloferax litoreum TaxID=2666140 RepID=A0A6A8GEL5_9EURY|nr:MULTISPECIES: hypothetical protein [Haloferax]KAB1193328.1 hypothetical protein Hfx1148_07665 [Haloferax sp. CBA1148]MRX21834.1 hypothetical protein [Haloferax litoreum]